MIAPEVFVMEMTWKALADPVRREILELLREAPRTTGEICVAFPDLTRFGVMNHMAVLKEAGLMRAEHRGRERLNHIDPRPLRTAYEDWIRNYEVLWAGRLGRLKRVAETKGAQVEMAGSTPIVANLTTLDIRRDIEIDATPADVFRALTLDIGEWWGQPYLRDGTRDIVLDAVPGGLLQQVSRDGGYVMCTVQEIRRDRLIVLDGRMGMEGAVFGTIRFELIPVSQTRTRLQLTQWALGNLTEETKAHFVHGWDDLLGTRLRLFIEKDVSRGIRALGSDVRKVKGGKK